jgi:hypothetical protein
MCVRSGIVLSLSESAVSIIIVLCVFSTICELCREVFSTLPQQHRCSMFISNEQKKQAYVGRLIF